MPKVKSYLSLVISPVTYFSVSCNGCKYTSFTSLHGRQPSFWSPLAEAGVSTISSGIGQVTGLLCIENTLKLTCVIHYRALISTVFWLVVSVIQSLKWFISCLSLISSIYCVQFIVDTSFTSLHGRQPSFWSPLAEAGVTNMYGELLFDHQPIRIEL